MKLKLTNFNSCFLHLYPCRAVKRLLIFLMFFFYYLKCYDVVQSLRLNAEKNKRKFLNVLKTFGMQTENFKDAPSKISTI